MTSQLDFMLLNYSSKCIILVVEYNNTVNYTENDLLFIVHGNVYKVHSYMIAACIARYGICAGVV